MAYIGSTPTSQNFTSGTDYFSGTGSQTAFTLTRTVNSVNDIEVVINNVVQQPSTAYTLSGTTVTFTSAPSSGTNNIYVRYLATNMQSFTVSANSIDKSKLSSDLQAGFQGRNKIINGAMVIDQRNAGASVTVNNLAQFFCVDRFFGVGQAADGVFTLQQSTDAPEGFTYSLKATVTTADASIGASQIYLIQHRIEGLNTSDLGFGTSAAKTVTISFKVKSSVTGSFGARISNQAANRSYPFSYTINSANTWETKSVTIAGDTSGTWVTNNGIGIAVIFSLGVGSTYTGTANTWASADYIAPTGSVNLISTSGATFYITGVQLEEGTTATSFEREIYSTTLQKCQRYYQQSGSTPVIANASTGATGALQFLVQMRASPTASLTNRMSITDTFSADYTQSSAGIFISGGGARVNSLGMNYDLTNFSGLTSGKSYITLPVSYQNGIICMSAEL